MLVLLESEGHLNCLPGLVGVRVVGNDGSIIAGCSGDLASISELLLKVANNGSLGHLANGQNVSNAELCLLSAENELSSMHTLTIIIINTFHGFKLKHRNV